MDNVNFVDQTLLFFFFLETMFCAQMILCFLYVEKETKPFETHEACLLKLKCVLSAVL